MQYSFGLSRFMNTAAADSDAYYTTLDHAAVGTLAEVIGVDGANASPTGITVGEMIRVMSLSPRGSAIVQRASGEQVCLNRALTSGIQLAVAVNA